ncbi:hypothetical protein L873DRAFT_888467 [Choiromyces venosus 120613-1]|uniref:Uncharacterized protein n=1 Tax=Choiromyces venosus 120613-1 TaxID=1336337 RepID=A0A3N4JR92_9PEZI|nr:hypothetical protein L873DRAFT_888467 [Choiromyces venosus 120613-1]
MAINKIKKASTPKPHSPKSPHHHRHHRKHHALTHSLPPVLYILVPYRVRTRYGMRVQVRWTRRLDSASERESKAGTVNFIVAQVRYAWHGGKV